MDNKKHYEKFDWDSVTEDKLNIFQLIVSESIPHDVSSILDVGCGNGILSNKLAKTYKVTAVDRNPYALESVKTDKICASADAIPLPDKSFDLVLSTEMIEHLDNATLGKTIEELKRISKKYVLITTPNNEDIDKFLVKCPSCGYVFNINYHLQKISRERLTSLFSEYDVQKQEVFGIKVRPYRSWLSGIKRKYAPANSWIPFFWKFSPGRNSMCPKCEQSFSYPYKFNILALSTDILNMIISPKKPYYQLSLFAKKDKFMTKD